jgi:hypothetical protein
LCLGREPCDVPVDFRHSRRCSAPE